MRRGERGTTGSRAVRCRAVVAMQCRRAAPRTKVQWRRCTRSPSACLLPSCCPSAYRRAARRHGCLGAHGPRRSSAFQIGDPPPPSLRSVRSCRKDDIGAHFMHRSALSVHSSSILLIFILRDAPLRCPPFIQDRVAAMIILDGKYPSLKITCVSLKETNLLS